jgi:ElaB/YqjD/DUF883 family membrane-anchored ribosome-binding protein
VKENAMSAANDFSNDARNLKDQVVAGANHVAENAGDELARLRSQVEKLMSERVTPALGEAADTVQDYAHRARESIEDQADSIAGQVRDRPLIAVGIAAVAGYLLGRLMTSNTYVYPRDRH